MKTKLVISGLAFLAITTVAGAQNNRPNQHQKNCTAKCIEYVDANKNGICDNYEKSATAATGNQKPGRGKNCGRGQGHRGMGQRQGNKINFTDADKNGICDYYEVPAKK